MSALAGLVLGSPMVASSSAILKVLLAISAEYLGREMVLVMEALRLPSSEYLYFSKRLGRRSV